ncbi:hypothetical protein IWQ52_000601 [Labrenzia sp. EL_159]|nr:hypothetical protein [Labrenzia sp. EL_162]MBG6193099.1 hypothetical protein [Labrenzia sp. EL_159]
MKHALPHSLPFFFFTGFTAMASPESLPESRISVPVTVSLPDLARYANDRLPGTLHRQEYGKTCMEPEKACTKVPEFRGFKVTMKNRCVEVTPRIDCTITETVLREGPMRLSVNGGQIVLQQDVFGSGTVRGRGEIGKNIRQTVRAKAQLTVTASPRILPDWSPDIALDISYRWLQRPEFKLFNLFPITLGSTLGPPLDKAIKDFKNNGLKTELDRIDLKSDAERVWQAIQGPYHLELPGNEALYMHLRPHAVGLAGPTFDNNTLHARLDIALTAQVSGNASGPAKTSLPNMTQMEDAGVSLKVPVRVYTKTLNTLVAKSLPKTLSVGEEDSVTVTVHQVAARIDGDRLSLDMIVDASGGQLTLNREAVNISARPFFDSGNQEIQFTDIALTSADTGFAGYAKSAILSAATLFLADTLSFDLNNEIAALEKAMNAALNRELTSEFALTGSGELKFSDLRLLPDESSLEVSISTTGNVRIVGFNPVK